MAELSEKQHKALAALIAEPTITAAAAASGVGQRTLYAWLKDADFAAAYRDARREAVQHAIARLQQRSSKAADTLGELMDDARPTVRLAAAKAVLEAALKSVEIDDILVRLAGLERMSNG